MLHKNSFLAGALAGMVFPAIAAVVAFWLKYNVTIINKPALPYFVAIAINLILIRVSTKNELPQTAKGIMVVTFVCMILVFLFKIHPIR